jgi:hypothetical protein
MSAIVADRSTSQHPVDHPRLHSWVSLVDLVTKGLADRIPQYHPRLVHHSYVLSHHNFDLLLIEYILIFLTVKY